MSAPFDLSLLPRRPTVDRRRPRRDRRRRPRRARRASSARRCTSTTRPSCAPRCREYHAGFGAGAAYASKAFLCTAMARLVAEEGLELDVATGGELHVALHAGFPAERIVFHGNNKSDDELQRAVDARSRPHRRRLVRRARPPRRSRSRWCRGARAPRARHARRRGAHARVHRDGNRGLEVRVRTATMATRSQPCTRVVATAPLRVRGHPLPHRLAGVPRSTRSRARSTRWSASCATIEATTGATVDELNLGGGLGVRYLTADAPPTIDAVLQRSCATRSTRRSPRPASVPGRA